MGSKLKSAKGKARKQARGKPLKRSLPWFLWPAIGLAIVAVVALVSISPANETAGLNDSGELKAVIIDQLYAFDQPNQEFIGEVTDTLENYGFKVDLYQGDEVTVDLYRKLPEQGYKLIILRTHAGIIEGQVSARQKTSLFTGERYSRTKYVKEQLSEELAMATVSEGSPFYFAIDSKFITNRMEGQFNDTVLIISGCSALYLHDLAQAFTDRGASAYLAWDDAVRLDYVDDATVALIENLCIEGLTIDEAVAKTMEEKGPDPEWGAVLKYYPAESGNKTITELIGKS